MELSSPSFLVLSKPSLAASSFVELIWNLSTIERGLLHCLAKQETGGITQLPNYSLVNISKVRPMA